MHHHPLTDLRCLLMGLKSQVCLRWSSQTLVQVWAYANLGFNPGKELMGAAALQAQKEMWSYSSQNVSNILWAFARLGHKDEVFIMTAVGHVIRQLADFSPQSVVGIS